MKKSRIVLMSCCAPCSAAAIKQMKAEGRDFVVLFYNPNIFPRAEYDRRLSEQIKLCEKLGVKWDAPICDHNDWIREIQGLENNPERGARCAKCFAMRAAFGAKWARSHGYDRIASVFGVSPHKDKKQVDAAFLGAKCGDVEYLDYKFDFAPEPDAYRQKYCGCEFSETYKKAAQNGK